MVEGDPFINILLLGETGVGKSTFINSIINYLTYGEFKKAEKETLITMIPLKFTMQDKHGEYHEIQTGRKGDQNECFETGMSATQNVRPYVFPIGDGGIKVRLIDTPGIGDVRGIDQDNINCENILTYIEELDKLHAICYLFKPTHSRFTIYFQYCLSQILSRLEKSASNNIIFIFTNTRGTHYGPGDTFPNLEKVVEEIKSKHGVEIPLRKNMFCFDNEGFRYLVSTKKGVQFDDSIRKRNVESWDRSLEQCNNLIRYIIGDYENHPLEPYFIKGTSTVNGVRRLIVQFSKLLSETSQLISENVCTLQRHTDDLDLESHRLNELRETLYIPVTDLDIIKLNQPEMVCASTKCKEIYKVGDINKFHYKQVCQSPCYLSNMPPETIGSPELLNCDVIDRSTKACKICGCDFSAHMQVYYSTQKRETKIIDNNVKKDFDCKEKFLRDTKNLITKYKEENDGLEKEYNTILQVCTRFADFLRRKVIVPFCDSYKEYTEYLILQEKSLGVASNASNVQHLQKLLQEYEPVKQLFNETLSSEKISEHILITSQYVHQTLKELYDLKYHGSKIREIKAFNAKEYKSTEYDVEGLLHSDNGKYVTKNSNTNEFQQSRRFYNFKDNMRKDYNRRNKSPSEIRSVTRASSECDLYSIDQWQAQDNPTDKFESQNSDNDQLEKRKPRSRMRGRGRGQWHNRHRNQSPTRPGGRNQRSQSQGGSRRSSPTETQSTTRNNSECDLDSRGQWQAENNVADKFQFEDNNNDELLKQPRSGNRMRGRGRGQWRNRYANHSQTRPGARNQRQTDDERNQSQSQDRESDQQSQVHTELNPNFQGQGNISGNRARGRGRGQWRNRARNQSTTTDQSQSQGEESNESQTRSGLRGRGQRRGTGGWVGRRGRNQLQPLAKSQTEGEKEPPILKNNEKTELEYPNRGNDGSQPRITTIGQVQFDSKGRRYISDRDLSPSLKTGSGRSYNPPSIRGIKKGESQSVKRSDFSQSYTREVGGNSYGKGELQKDNVSEVTNFNLTQKYENMFKRQTNHNFSTVNYNLPPRKTIDNQYHDNTVKRETNHNFPTINHNPPPNKTIINQPLILMHHNPSPRKIVNNQPQMLNQNSTTQGRTTYAYKSTYNEVGLDANRYFEAPKMRQNFVTNRVVTPNYNQLQNKSSTSHKSEKCCLL